MLVSQNVPHLLDGISQRPANLRKSSEGTAQVNSYDNMGRGKQKRPPVELVAKLSSTITGLDTAFLHTISRDTIDRFHVIIANGDLKVYDAITGVVAPISYPNGKTYLTPVTPPPVVHTVVLTGADGVQLSAFIASTGLGMTKWGTEANSQFRTFNGGNLSWGNNVVPVDVGYRYNFPVPTADYQMSAAVTWPAPRGPINNDYHAVYVRGNLTNKAAYILTLELGGSWALQILDSAGAGTPLASGTIGGFDATIAHTFGLEVIGNILTPIFDGVRQGSTVNGVISAAGYAGIGGSGTGDNNGADGVATRAIMSSFSITYSKGATPTALQGFRAVTIGDYTFITNRNKVVGKTANLVTTRPPEALVFVRQADYSTAYKLTVDATTLTHTTGDGLSPASRAAISTDTIAEALRVLFVASALNATHTCTRTGSTLYIKRINNAAFTVTATDGMADNAILAIKGSIQRFDDLPLRAVNGVIIEVTGDPGSLYDNYHVVYDDSGSASGAGVWRETVKPGELYQLDPATMPYVLINNFGTFSFQQAAWRGREVGSTVTNPFPSFVGQPIKELFFTQGRFGVTSDENIILTGTSDVFNFFRKSAKALYDNDPIDISSASTKIQNWHSVIEWDTKPLLWSDQGQVLLLSEPILSPKTVRLQPLTSYENQPNVRPELIGNDIVFAQIINNKTRLSLYRTVPNSDKPEAVDLTTAIPSYFAGTPSSVKGTDEPGFIAVLSSSAPNSIYVYLSGQDATSWSRWDIESTSTIIGMDYVGGQLGLLVKRSDGLYLEKIVVGKADLLASSGDTLTPLFDHQTAAVGAGAGASYTLPMSVATNGSEGEVVVFRTDTKVEVVSTRPTPTTVQVAANITGIPIVYGIRYTSSYTLSPIAIVNTGRDGRQQKETAGKLIIGHIVLRLQDTSYVLVTVTSPEGVVYTYPYSLAVPLASDILKFTVQADALLATIVISNDKGVQHTLAGFDWEGNHVIRSARR